MKGESFNCSLCDYNTNKKYNLNRHIDCKHKKTLIQNVVFSNQNIDNNTNMNNQNVVQNNENDQNVVLSNQNVVIDNQNLDYDNKCPNCSKKLSSKLSVKRHLNICKGVLNTLECHLCHKTFADYSSKSHHLKKCKIKNLNNQLSLSNSNSNNDIIINSSNVEIIPIKNDSVLVPITQVNNISNTINTINNTININLIYYDKEENKIIFDITHIKEDIVYKIVTRDDTDAFKYFCDKLFENKNNQLIVKKSLRDNYSKVHVGFNYWEKLLDEFIYPKLMSNISETMITYIDENKGKHRKTKIEYIMNYLHIMASNGYSYKNTNEYKKKYKNNIDMLKILFNSFL